MESAEVDADCEAGTRVRYFYVLETRNKMKTFKENGVEYSIRQDMGRKGIQYKARYVSDPTVTEAWVFLPGRKHTRKQIVAAIDRVNTYNELDE